MLKSRKRLSIYSQLKAPSTAITNRKKSTRVTVVTLIENNIYLFLVYTAMHGLCVTRRVVVSFRIDIVERSFAVIQGNSRKPVNCPVPRGKGIPKQTRWLQWLCHEIHYRHFWTATNFLLRYIRSVSSNSSDSFGCFDRNTIKHDNCQTSCAVISYSLKRRYSGMETVSRLTTRDGSRVLECSNGSVFFAGRWIVAGWWPRRPRWPGWSVMMRNRGRPSRRWWRMSPVGGVVPFFAAGRRRWRSIFLFLQKLSEFLDRFVQGPQLREQRQIQLSKSKLEKNSFENWFWWWTFARLI